MMQKVMEMVLSVMNDGPKSIGPNGSHMPPQYMNGLDIIGIATILAIIVGIANICLLLALISIYLKNYKQLKSKFTTGLLVFASLLLLQNLVSVLFLALKIILGPQSHTFEFGGQEFPLSSINVIQLIALSILLYITWE